MRVLFIHEYLPQEMLGLMWLSRALKDAGHETRALFLPDARWLETVESFAPDVVAYSVTTGTHFAFADLNRKVKAALPSVFSVFGGPHPTFTPRFIETDGVDAICRGEGEQAFVELLDKLQSGEDHLGTENFWFKHPTSGAIVENAQRPLVRDLDTLGFPDREIVYAAGALYRDSGRKVFATQRGCPMNCSFCFHPPSRRKVHDANNKDYMRRRSVSHVLAEIRDVRARYELKFVHFLDDVFNWHDAWLEEFCARYPFEIGLPFDVILSAERASEAQVRKLRSAGCVYARITLERGKARGVQPAKYEPFLAAASWVKQHGIRLGSLNLLGGPDGTVEDAWESLAANVAARVDHPLVTVLQQSPELDGVAPKVRTTSSASPVEFEREHLVENLHKWFACVVRHPWLEPLARRAVHQRALSKAYLVLHLVFAEYLAAEQAGHYARAQGLRGPRHWAAIDFVRRLAAKTALRVHRLLLGRHVDRFPAPRRLALSLQVGDERVAVRTE